MKTTDNKEIQKQEKLEEKKSKKAFNWMVRNARKKGALVEVKYSNS